MSDDNGKVISFEECRRRKLGRQYKPDIFSLEFEKSLSEQKELLDWYRFNRYFNKHRLFLHALLKDNESRENNHDCGFVLVYNVPHFQSVVASLTEAIDRAKRKITILDFSGKSFIVACSEVLHGNYKTLLDAYQAIEDRLISSDDIVLITRLSESTTSLNKTGVASDLIKAISDVPIRSKSIAQGSLIFIDSPAFLQRAWPSIGIYLNVLG
ncbi:MAG TPA: hypothetical protein VGO35_06540 [Gammaproteobacteria bacterium]|jgi:hypothetical protein|nr:hypothetical protein [Gammaproteobacteria bacterium]